MTSASASSMTPRLEGRAQRRPPANDATRPQAPTTARALQAPARRRRTLRSRQRAEPWRSRAPVPSKERARPAVSDLQNRRPAEVVAAGSYYHRTRNRKSWATVHEKTVLAQGFRSGRRDLNAGPLAARQLMSHPIARRRPS